MSTVAEVGSVRLGRQRSPANQAGRHLTKYLRAANITADGLDLEDVLEMNFTPAERETFSLATGDVVLAEASGSGTHVGRAALWRGEIAGCCYQNTVIRFRPHLATSAYSLVVFRYYSLSGVFARTARGTGILHLGATRFSRMRFPLPPMAEQVRIANEVDRRTQELRAARSSLDSALENIALQTKAIVAAAASGYLVEAEAAIALREGRGFEDGQELLYRVHDQSEPSGRYRLQSAMPNPTAILDAPLPEGWTWCRADAVGEVTIGRRRDPRYEQGPYMRPYLRVRNVQEDYIDTSDIRQMNFVPEEFKTYRLRWGDILLNEGQSPELVGRAAMFRDEIPGACFQNSLLRFRGNPAVDPAYALLVFRYYLHRGIFKEVARWTTNIAHLSLSRLAELPFPLPPLREQQRIAAEAAKRLEASAAQERATKSSLSRLPELEQEVLAEAVQGRLVTQDPSDEPALTTLARLGSAPNPAPAPSQRSTRRVKQDNLEHIYETAPYLMPMGSNPVPVLALPEVLRSAGRPLTLPELFAMAGYDRDNTQYIEHFYLTLRNELGVSLQVNEVNGVDYVEVIDRASS